jgi:beta-glucanase (GH16 family)
LFILIKMYVLLYIGPSGEVWNYTSGWVDTQGMFAQYQGRWEVTAKLPSADCWGAWPAVRHLFVYLF